MSPGDYFMKWKIENVAQTDSGNDFKAIHNYHLLIKVHVVNRKVMGM